MIGKIAVWFLLLSGFNRVNAQTAWTLITEKEGIKIYSGPASASKIKPIKVECTFNATTSQLIAVLLDIKAYTDWVYHTKSAMLVKQVSPSELYYYSEVSVPWPAQNRDFVAHATITQQADTKAVIFDAPSVAGFVAEKSGICRIYESKGKWIITPLANKQVKVFYFLQIDPGKGAPVWLVNLFATDGPLQTFKKLKTQLQKPAYKNAVFTFIENYG